MNLAVNDETSISLDQFLQHVDDERFIRKSDLRSDGTMITKASTNSGTRFDESLVWSDCMTSVSTGWGTSSSDRRDSCTVKSTSDLSAITKGNGIRSEILKHNKKSQVADLEFHKIIGEGEFGQVWIASIKDSKGDDGSSDLLAVKVLSKHGLVMKGKDCVDNVVREIRVLRAIKTNSDRNRKHNHPCLTKMIDTRYDENLIYILQEFYSGGEVFAMLHGDMSDVITKNVRFYAACIIDAVGFLHSKGIIYRDIKPENIVIRQDTGYPVLVDFGYAKQLKRNSQKVVDSGSLTPPRTRSLSPNNSKWIKSGNSSWTRKQMFENSMNEITEIPAECENSKSDNGSKSIINTSPEYDEKCYSMVGTPRYVAPEVILGTGHDFRADLWSFGVLVYEMFAAYNPMVGPYCDDLDERELLRCITEEDYVPLPKEIQNNEPNATQLIHELLARDPKDRLASAAIVERHQWFDGIDFRSLRKQKIEAPWKPNIPLHQNKSDLSTPYFDNMDHLQNDPEKSFFKTSYPKLSTSEIAMFQTLEANISKE